MRSLTFVIVVMAMSLGTANAQEETSPHRLTADVFISAGFPADIIEAAQLADEVAKRTQENRAMAKQDLDLIEPIFDRAVFMPQIPLQLFEKLQNEYETVLQRLWDTDREIRQADDRVSYLYHNWAPEDLNAQAAQVFQEWQTASRLNYLTVSEDEAEAYRLMIGIGRSRIIAGYREHSHNPWSRPAPLTMWRVNNVE